MNSNDLGLLILSFLPSVLAASILRASSKKGQEKAWQLSPFLEEEITINDAYKLKELSKKKFFFFPICISVKNFTYFGIESF